MTTDFSNPYPLLADLGDKLTDAYNAARRDPSWRDRVEAVQSDLQTTVKREERAASRSRRSAVIAGVLAVSTFCAGFVLWPLLPTAFFLAASTVRSVKAGKQHAIKADQADMASHKLGLSSEPQNKQLSREKVVEEIKALRDLAGPAALTILGSSVVTTANMYVLTALHSRDVLSDAARRIRHTDHDQAVKYIRSSHKLSVQVEQAGDLMREPHRILPGLLPGIARRRAVDAAERSNQASLALIDAVPAASLTETEVRSERLHTIARTEIDPGATGLGQGADRGADRSATRFMSTGRFD